MTSFNYQDEKLAILGTDDLIHYDVINNDCYNVPSTKEGRLRDPSAMVIQGTVYLVYSKSLLSTGFHSTSFGLSSTKDYINYTELSDTNVAPNFSNVWAPAWSHIDGGIYVVANCQNKTTGTFFPCLYSFNLSTENFSFNRILRIENRNNIIDAHLYEWDNSYYLVYKNEDAKYIEIARSDSLNNVFEVMCICSQFGSQVEGPAVLSFGNGIYYIVYENYSSNTMYAAIMQKENDEYSITDPIPLVFSDGRKYSHGDFISLY